MEEILTVEKSLAVVVVSGGMDSCVTAAVAAQDHDLAFLHVNYGQRTERRELRAFEEIAGFARFLRLRVGEVRPHAGCPLRQRLHRMTAARVLQAVDHHELRRLLVFR
mgnify:CR=1 FL=1